MYTKARKTTCFDKSFFQLYLPTASYIATQLYSAMPSDIVLAQFKGKYNITETKGFNITFALQKYHSIKDGISLKITCIYYERESHEEKKY